MLNLKQNQQFSVIFRLVSIVLVVVLNIPTAFAATLIPVNDRQIQEIDSPIEQHVIIDDSTLQMVTTETIEAYEEPSTESRAIYRITGGTVVSADMNSLNNDLITIEYCGKICYADGTKFKAIVGDANTVSEQINEIHQAYKYDAENALEIVQAPHHYIVGEKVLYYNYQDYIWSACVKFGIEEYFTYLLAQFYHESKFKQDSHSHTNDYGICQLNATYHESFKRKVGHPEWDLINDPYANMYCGVHIMSRKIKARNGNLDLAMTDYNAGAGYTAKHGVREVYCNRVHYWHSRTKALD